MNTRPQLIHIIVSTAKGDNWATCDQMSPKIFRKNKAVLLARIKKWIESDKTFTVRLGVKMLMEHFLDDDFDPFYPEMVAGLRSEEYYSHCRRESPLL